jgi:hypothetical protein
MVTDGYHRPVSGYKVVFNGKQQAVSNETGMFALDGIRAGTGTLTGEKSGYLPIKQTVMIIDKRQLLYVSATSIEEIFDQTDRLFAERVWHSAEELLTGTLEQIAKQKDAPTGLLRFYLASALYKQGKLDQAAAILADLSGIGVKKTPKTGMEETASLFYFKLVKEMSEGAKKAAEVYYDGT